VDGTRGAGGRGGVSPGSSPASRICRCVRPCWPARRTRARAFSFATCGPSRLATICSRDLRKRRVFPQQPNEVLAELFGARVIDPRVLSCKPLIDALINNVPKEGYRPVAGGSLDLQTAWLALLQAMFGECWDAPNLGNVLAWSFDERRIRALAELDEALRGALTDWLSQTLGPVAQFVLAAMATRVGSDLVALGLLLDLLNQPECRGVAEAQVARGRLEQHFGHREIDEASAKAWAMAAGDLLWPSGHHGSGVGQAATRRVGQANRAGPGDESGRAQPFLA